MKGSREQGLKRIEIGIRRWVNARLHRSQEPVRIERPTQTFSLNDRPRILFLRQDRIGDVLVSIPVIKAIHAALPHAEIDILLGENNMAVQHACTPFVRSILTYQKSFGKLIGLIRTIRARKYDVVIDLMDNASTTSSLLVSWSGARYALGIDKENRSVYTHVVPLRSRADVHIVERLAMLLLPFGIDPSQTPLDLTYDVSTEERNAAMAFIAPPSEHQGHLYVGVNISGSDLSRMYDKAKMIEVLRVIHDEFEDARTFIFSSPQHAKMRDEIAVAVGADAVPTATSFHDFACRLSCMDAILTVDTSVVHLAAAWKTPSVVLFVHDAPHLMPWTPYASPCWPVETTTTSLNNIPAHDVIEAMRSMLRTFNA